MEWNNKIKIIAQKELQNKWKEKKISDDIMFVTNYIVKHLINTNQRKCKSVKWKRKKEIFMCIAED